MSKNEQEWKTCLTPEQFDILRRKGTERPFSGKLLHGKEEGYYACAGCGTKLFSSVAKFESGTGWPSFSDATANVGKREDRSYGMVRTEVFCKKCGGHLGHVFEGWPKPADLYYCINSAALEFKKSRKNQGKIVNFARDRMKDSGLLVELHSHTHHSHGSKLLYDGVSAPEDMVKAAAKKGLHALCVTDHNTVRGALESKRFAKKYGILIIPGEEVTTDKGHMLALGIEETIPEGTKLAEAIDIVHAAGGISIASHPFDIGKVGMGEFSASCDAIEVFNAINFDRFSNRNAKKWASRKGLVGVASSDAHFPAMIGNGVTEVLTGDCDIDSILNGIKKGHIKLHKRYTPMPVLMRWNIERFHKSKGHTVNVIEENYRGPKKALSKWLLNLSERSPGKVDCMLTAMAYTGLFGAIAYSAIRELRKKV